MANDRKATLGTKNRDRWMVLSTGARNENEGAHWSTIP